MSKANARPNFVVMAAVVLVLLLMAVNKTPSINQNNAAAQASTGSGTTNASASSSPTSEPTYDEFYWPSPLPDGYLFTPWPTGDDPQQNVAVPTAGQAAPTSKISPELAAEVSSNKGDIEFFVVLSEQADVSGNNTGKDQRVYAYEKESEVANRTQPAVKAALIELQKRDDVKEFKAFTLVNEFYVKGTAKAVATLAQREDIDSLILMGYLDAPTNNFVPLPLTMPTPAKKPFENWVNSEV